MAAFLVRDYFCGNASFLSRSNAESCTTWQAKRDVAMTIATLDSFWATWVLRHRMPKTSMVGSFTLAITFKLNYTRKPSVYDLWNIVFASFASRKLVVL